MARIGRTRGGRRLLGVPQRRGGARRRTGRRDGFRGIAAGRRVRPVGRGRTAEDGRRSGDDRPAGGRLPPHRPRCGNRDHGLRPLRPAAADVGRLSQAAVVERPPSRRPLAARLRGVGRRRSAAAPGGVAVGLARGIAYLEGAARPAPEQGRPIRRFPFVPFLRVSRSGDRGFPPPRGAGVAVADGARRAGRGGVQHRLEQQGLFLPVRRAR